MEGEKDRENLPCLPTQDTSGSTDLCRIKLHPPLSASTQPAANPHSTTAGDGAEGGEKFEELQYGGGVTAQWKQSGGDAVEGQKSLGVTVGEGAIWGGTQEGKQAPVLQAVDWNCSTAEDSRAQLKQTSYAKKLIFTNKKTTTRHFSGNGALNRTPTGGGGGGAVAGWTQGDTSADMHTCIPGMLLK